MKLKDIPTKQSFVEALDERLDPILLDKQDVEAVWITLWDCICYIVTDAMITTQQ